MTTEKGNERQHKSGLIQDAENRVMTDLIAFADAEGLWPEDDAELIELFGERCRTLIESKEFKDGFLPAWWLFQPFPVEDKTAAWESYADEFFTEREGQLREEDKALLRAVREAPYGVYRVEKVDAAKGAAITDMATGQGVDVNDVRVPKGLEAGQIIYARVPQMHGIKFFFGLAPFVLPQEFNPAVESVLRDVGKLMVEKVTGREAFPLAELRGDVVRRAYFLMAAESLAPA